MVSIFDPNRVLLCRYCQVYFRGLDNLIKHEKENHIDHDVRNEIDKEGNLRMGCSDTSNNIIEAESTPTRFSDKNINQHSLNRESDPIITHPADVESFKSENSGQSDSVRENQRKESGGQESKCELNLAKKWSTIDCTSSSRGSSSGSPVIIEEVNNEAVKGIVNTEAKEDPDNEGNGRPGNAISKSLLDQLKRTDNDVDDDEIEVIDVVLQDKGTGSDGCRQDGSLPFQQPRETCIVRISEDTNNPASVVLSDQAQSSKKLCSEETRKLEKAVEMKEHSNPANLSPSKSENINNDGHSNPASPSLMDPYLNMSPFSPIEPDEDEIVLACPWYNIEDSESSPSIFQSGNNDVRTTFLDLVTQEGAENNMDDVTRNSKICSPNSTLPCVEAVSQVSHPILDSLASQTETLPFHTPTSNATVCCENRVNFPISATPAQSSESSCSLPTVSPPSEITMRGQTPSTQITDEFSKSKDSVLQTSAVVEDLDFRKRSADGLTYFEISDSSSEVSDSVYHSPCLSPANSTSNSASSVSGSGLAKLTSVPSAPNFSELSAQPYLQIPNSVLSASESVLEEPTAPTLYTVLESSDASSETLHFMSRKLQPPRFASPQTCNPFSEVSHADESTKPADTVSNPIYRASAPVVQMSKTAAQILTSAHTTSTSNPSIHPSNFVPLAKRPVGCAPDQHPVTVDPVVVKKVEEIIKSGQDIPAATLYESICNYIADIESKRT